MSKPKVQEKVPDKQPVAGATTSESSDDPLMAADTPPAEEKKKKPPVGGVSMFGPGAIPKLGVTKTASATTVKKPEPRKATGSYCLFLLASIKGNIERKW